MTDPPERPVDGRTEDRPPPNRRAPGRPFPVSRLVLGGLLVLFGIAWLLEALDVADIPWSAVLPVALVFVGVVLVVGSRTARHGGLIGLGVVLVVILTVTSSLNVSLAGGIGDRRERPLSPEAIDETYRLAIGQLTVDLSAAGLPPGTTSIEASLGIGQLVVIVPRGTEIRVVYEVGAGEARIEAGGGREADDGLDVEDEFQTRGYDTASSRLSLTASVGLGQLTVREG